MPVHHGTDVLYVTSFDTVGAAGSIATVTAFPGFTGATGVTQATAASQFTAQLSGAGAGPAAGETFNVANFQYFTTANYTGGLKSTYYAGRSSANRSVVYIVDDKSWHYSPNTNGPLAGSGDS